MPQGSAPLSLVDLSWSPVLLGKESCGLYLLPENVLGGHVTHLVSFNPPHEFFSDDILKFIFIAVRYTEHKTYHFNHFQVYNSMRFKYSQCCATSPLSISRTFPSSQTETLNPLNTKSPCPPPSSLWQLLFYFLSLRICLL